jgi:hypothetical protein
MGCLTVIATVTERVVGVFVTFFRAASFALFNFLSCTTNGATQDYRRRGLTYDELLVPNYSMYSIEIEIKQNFQM